MKKNKIENEILTGYIPLSIIKLSEKWLEKRADGTKGNKGGQETLLKMFSIVKYKIEKETIRRRRNLSKYCFNKTFVHLSSSYFDSIFSSKFKKYIDFWKEHDVIIVKGRILDEYESKTSIFDDSVKVESYKVGEYSKAYRLKKFIGENYETKKFELKFKNNSVQNKNINFLISIGIHEPKLTKDNFGFRLYHNLSTSYKDVLPKKGSFIYYDIESSIPSQLKSYIETLLKKQELSSDPFLELYEGDFYENLRIGLNLEGNIRSDLKKKFATLLYGTKKDISPNLLSLIRSKYPFFYNLLNKSIGKRLTRLETKFIFGIVKKLPVEEVLTIHDGFIVWSEYEKEIDYYIESLNLTNTFK
jgi:hypothetical protein